MTPIYADESSHSRHRIVLTREIYESNEDETNGLYLTGDAARMEMRFDDRI